MKQIAQNVRSGDIHVVDVAPPSIGEGRVLVQVHASVISIGTERSSINERSQSLLTRARKNPELVARVWEQVRQQGVRATVQRVRGRLDMLTALGYSAAGTVLQVGTGVRGLSVGDRVACAGAGYANHAEIIAVPKNLCARIPDGVTFEDAAYTTVGAIALQGVRQAQPTLGETMAVIGLGLVGLLTVQLLKANGCVVIGIDPDPEAVRRAVEFGADIAVRRGDDVKRIIASRSGSLGADGVLITAATKSDDPVRLAGEIARDRGRVVLVGDVGLQLPRGPYYMKELDFRLSRSYGPGRYDPSYEEEGRDYPVGYVRWTERRNMEEFLRLIRSGAVRPQALTTHRFPIESARDAYGIVSGQRRSSSGRPFGVVITYDQASRPAARKEKSRRTMGSVAADPLAIGFIGAGSFAQSMLLPPLQQVPGVRLISVCNSTGISASNVATSFGFRSAVTDVQDVVADPEIGTVFIASRHYLHAKQVMAALRAGKHVFVEKPLAMLPEELHELERFYQGLPDSRRPLLMVGFNRRFSPAIGELRAFFQSVHSPRTIVYRINAGSIPLTHWTRDPRVGGGRVVGEVCHFMDLASFLAGSDPVRVHGEAMSEDLSTSEDDTVTASVKFTNGSLASIVYTAGGDPGLPKEEIQVTAGGRTGSVSNFRSVSLSSGGRTNERSWSAIDKGHASEVRAFLEAVRSGGPSPIAFDNLVRTTKATFAIEESIRRGRSVDM